MYVSRRTEPGLWTVGFYRPDGEWEAESDHESTADAAARVSYLNGGNPDGTITRARFDALVGVLATQIPRLDDLMLEREHGTL